MRLRRLVLAAGLGVIAVAPGAQAAGRSAEATWHATQVHSAAAQAAGRGGRGVVVAVLDGWVDRAHPDFEGRVLVGADCTSGTCSAGQHPDACEHGTHVAGTVASTSFGVAPDSTVLPVQVLVHDKGGDCTGSPQAVAAGIRWAVAHGADVLNLSLGPDVSGIGTSSALPTAVHEAAVAGVLVVFSAGNAARSTAQSYGQDALVVAATGPDGALASYSDRGSGVSLAAPGGQPDANGTCGQSDCVTSLYPGGQYAVAAGTSMAAPAVSAVAALLLAQDPRRTPAALRARLTSTARPLAEAGAGLLDARAALGSAPSRSAPSVAARPAPQAAVIPRRSPPRAVVALTPPRPVRRVTAPMRATPLKALPLPATTPSRRPAGPTRTVAPPPAPHRPVVAVLVRPARREVPVGTGVVALALLTVVGTGNLLQRRR